MTAVRRTSAPRMAARRRQVEGPTTPRVRSNGPTAWRRWRGGGHEQDGASPPPLSAQAAKPRFERADALGERVAPARAVVWRQFVEMAMQLADPCHEPGGLGTAGSTVGGRVWWMLGHDHASRAGSAGPHGRRDRIEVPESLSHRLV
jgi:hypothetical protein